MADGIRRWLINSEEKRLRLGWRLLGHLGLLALIFVLVSLPMAVAQITGIIPFSQLLIVGQTVSALTITAAVWLSRRWLDRRSFADLGFRLPRRLALQDLLVGFGVAAAAQVAMFLAGWLIGWLHLQGFAWQNTPWPRLLGDLTLMLATFILTGWTEELWMRGYFMTNFHESLGERGAVVLTALIFAALHGLNPGFSFSALFGLFAAGLIFALARLRSGGLWLPVGLHIGWNFFEDTILDFPVSGLNTPSLLIQGEPTGPDFFLGGAFGPEAGVVLFIGLAVVLAVILKYNRSAVQEFAPSFKEAPPA